MAQIIMTTRVRNTCVICNCMPVDETKETRPPLPMFHAKGVHVNWNDDCNICQLCARVMAEMLGMVEPDKARKLQEKLDALREEHIELEEAHEEQSERIRRILEGKKAEKAQREAA